MVAVTVWFAHSDLGAASVAQRRLVEQIGDLLASLSPARLDPAHQVVEVVDGETWVTLRHDRESWMEIRLLISDGWVNFYGVIGHDEAYQVPGEPDQSWESETIDILAALLGSKYQLDRYTLRGKPWREVVTISAPYGRTSTGFRSVTSSLPLARWARRVETRSATFESHRTGFDGS